MENRESQQRIHQLQQQIAGLQEKLDFYEEIFRKLPAIIYLYDCEKRSPVWVSRCISEFTGFSLDERLKTDSDTWYSERYHPDDVSMEIDTKERFTKEPDKNLSVIYRVKHKNGQWKWLLASGAVFKKRPDGTPENTIAVCADITNNRISEKRFASYLKEMRRMTNIHKINTLTKKENEVLKLLIQGHSVRKIAEMTFRSHHTIDNHKRNIMKKLNIHHICRLTEFALECGLV